MYFDPQSGCFKAVQLHKDQFGQTTVNISHYNSTVYASCNDTHL